MIIISKNPALAMTAVRLQPDRRDPPHPEPLAVLSPSPFLGIWVLLASRQWGQWLPISSRKCTQGNPTRDVFGFYTTFAS